MAAKRRFKTRVLRKALVVGGVVLILGGLLVDSMLSTADYSATARVEAPVAEAAKGGLARLIAATPGGRSHGLLASTAITIDGEPSLDLSGRMRSESSFRSAAQLTVDDINGLFQSLWPDIVSEQISRLAADRATAVAVTQQASAELGVVADGYVPLEPPPTLPEADADVAALAAALNRSVFDVTRPVVESAQARAQMALIDADIGALPGSVAPRLMLDTTKVVKRSDSTPLLAQIMVSLGVLSLLIGSVISLRRGRRQTRVIAASFLGLMVCWVLLLGFSLFSARGSITRVVELVESVQDNPDMPMEQLQETLDELDDSATSSHRAIGRPWVAVLRYVPVLGSQFQASEQLLGLAADAVRAGHTVLNQADLIGASLSDGNLSLQDAAERLADPATSAAARFADVAAFDSSRLPSIIEERVVEAEPEIDNAMIQLQRGEAMLSFLTALRSNRYLIVAGNPSDARAGMGAFLQFGTIATDSAGLLLSDLQGIGEGVGKIRFPAPGAVAPPPEMAASSGYLRPADFWQGLGLAYDFPANAALARDMWTASGQPPVEGVIYIDPVALSYIAEATGPIMFDGEQFDAQGLLFELLEGQYSEGASTEVNGLERYARQERAAALSQVVVDRALNMNFSDTGALLDVATALAQAADERHVMIWSSEPQLQDQLVQGGLAGRQDPHGLQVWISQLSGKWDDYLAVTANLDIACGAVATVTIDVRVRFDGAPGRSAEFDWIEAFWQVPQGQVIGLAGLNFPLSATNITGDIGDRRTTTGRSGAAPLTTSLFALGAGQERLGRVSFDLPASSTLKIGPSGRLGNTTWNHQGEPLNGVESHRLVVC